MPVFLSTPFLEALESFKKVKTKHLTCAALCLHALSGAVQRAMTSDPRCHDLPPLTPGHRNATAAAAATRCAALEIWCGR